MDCSTTGTLLKKGDMMWDKTVPERARKILQDHLELRPGDFPPENIHFLNTSLLNWDTSVVELWNALSTAAETKADYIDHIQAIAKDFWFWWEGSGIYLRRAAELDVAELIAGFIQLILNIPYYQRWIFLWYGVKETYAKENWPLFPLSDALEAPMYMPFNWQTVIGAPEAKLETYGLTYDIHKVAVYCWRAYTGYVSVRDPNNWFKSVPADWKIIVVNDPGPINLIPHYRPSIKVFLIIIDLLCDRCSKAGRTLCRCGVDHLPISSKANADVAPFPLFVLIPFFISGNKSTIASHYYNQRIQALKSRTGLKVIMLGDESAESLKLPNILSAQMVPERRSFKDKGGLFSFREFENSFRAETSQCFRQDPASQILSFRMTMGRSFAENDCVREFKGYLKWSNLLNLPYPSFHIDMANGQYVNLSVFTKDSAIVNRYSYYCIRILGDLLGVHSCYLHDKLGEDCREVTDLKRFYIDVWKLIIKDPANNTVKAKKGLGLVTKSTFTHGPGHQAWFSGTCAKADGSYEKNPMSKQSMFLEFSEWMLPTKLEEETSYYRGISRIDPESLEKIHLFLGSIGWTFSAFISCFCDSAASVHCGNVSSVGWCMLPRGPFIFLKNATSSSFNDQLLGTDERLAGAVNAGYGLAVDRYLAEFEEWWAQNSSRFSLPEDIATQPNLASTKRSSGLPKVTSTMKVKVGSKDDGTPAHLDMIVGTTSKFMFTSIVNKLMAEDPLMIQTSIESMAALHGGSGIAMRDDMGRNRRIIFLVRVLAFLLLRPFQLYTQKYMEDRNDTMMGVEQQNPYVFMGYFIKLCQLVGVFIAGTDRSQMDRTVSAHLQSVMIHRLTTGKHNAEFSAMLDSPYLGYKTYASALLEVMSLERKMPAFYHEGIVLQYSGNPSGNPDTMLSNNIPNSETAVRIGEAMTQGGFGSMIASAYLGDDDIIAMHLKRTDVDTYSMVNQLGSICVAEVENTANPMKQDGGPTTCACLNKKTFRGVNLPNSGRAGGLIMAENASDRDTHARFALTFSSIYSSLLVTRIPRAEIAYEYVVNSIWAYRPQSMIRSAERAETVMTKVNPHFRHLRFPFVPKIKTIYMHGDTRIPRFLSNDIIDDGRLAKGVRPGALRNAPYGTSRVLASCLIMYGPIDPFIICEVGLWMGSLGTESGMFLPWHIKRHDYSYFLQQRAMTSYYGARAVLKVQASFEATITDITVPAESLGLPKPRTFDKAQLREAIMSGLDPRRTRISEVGIKALEELGDKPILEYAEEHVKMVEKDTMDHGASQFTRLFFLSTMIGYFDEMFKHHDLTALRHLLPLHMNIFESDEYVKHNGVVAREQETGAFIVHKACKGRTIVPSEGRIFDLSGIGCAPVCPSMSVGLLVANCASTLHAGFIGRVVLKGATQLWEDSQNGSAFIPEDLMYKYATLILAGDPRGILQLAATGRTLSEINTIIQSIKPNAVHSDIISCSVPPFLTGSVLSTSKPELLKQVQATSDDTFDEIAMVWALSQLTWSWKIARVDSLTKGLLIPRPMRKVSVFTEGQWSLEGFSKLHHWKMDFGDLASYLGSSPEVRTEALPNLAYLAALERWPDLKPSSKGPGTRVSQRALNLYE